MTPQIQNLLEELYAVDPALRSKEKELHRIIEILLKAKPNIMIDESFKQQLRAELQRIQPKRSFLNAITDINRIKSFNYVFGGVLCLLLIIGAVFVQMDKNKTSNQLAQGRIIKLADNAFGNLNGQTTTGLGGGNQSLSSPVSGSAGIAENSTQGGAAAPMSLAPSATSKMVAPDMGIGGGGTGANANLRIYQPTAYKYVYSGKPIEIPSNKLEVLKKVPNPTYAQGLIDILRKMKIGLNLGSFGDLRVDNVSLSENKPGGYTFNIDNLNGNFNIWQQYIPVDCGTGGMACPTIAPFRAPDVPDDQTMISIANKFLKDHGVDTSHYGKPEVMDNWKIMYLGLSAAEQQNFAVPDMGTVIYPLDVNGINVYDQSGNKYGMQVSVSFRTKQVTGMSEFNFSDYQSSLYSTETDTAKIMALVEQGGLDSYQPENPSNVVEIELGSPSIQLMRYWTYQNGTQQELFVPSIVFPITNTPKDANIYRNAVVVPIIKDILDSHQSPIYRIMEKSVPPVPAAQ